MPSEVEAATLEDVLRNHNTRIAALEKQNQVLMGIIDAQDKFNTIIADKVADNPVIAH